MVVASLAVARLGAVAVAIFARCVAGSTQDLNHAIPSSDLHIHNLCSLA
jgi:hypothetical protein